MADGFKIDMDAEKAEQLRAAAKAQGVEPAEYARLLLEQALEDQADKAEIERRWARFEATGDAIDNDEIIALLKQRAAG